MARQTVLALALAASTSGLVAPPAPKQALTKARYEASAALPFMEKPEALDGSMVRALRGKRCVNGSQRAWLRRG